MGSVYSCTNHRYFNYTPIWNDGPDPLPIKVANVVFSIFINLATFFANACIGLGDLLDNLFTATSPPTRNSDSVSYDAGYKSWRSPGSPSYLPPAPSYSKPYPTPNSSSVTFTSSHPSTSPPYFPEPSAPPYSELYPTPSSPSPSTSTQSTFSSNLPEAPAPQYSKFYPTPSAPPWDPSWGPYPG